MLPFREKHNALESSSEDERTAADQGESLTNSNCAGRLQFQAVFARERLDKEQLRGSKGTSTV